VPLEFLKLLMNINLDNNSKIQRVKHTFLSNFANASVNGRFYFEFREPPVGIIGARAKSVTICNFAAIGNSSTYYLRTDCIFGTRDASYINTRPDFVAMVIPNAPQIAGQPIVKFDDGDSFIHSEPRLLFNCWFEIFDQTITLPINPTDAGWYFTVELEFLIKKSC
jgi:hypothetical protein